MSALLLAVVVLPTALRPPPDPTASSGAINPNAPPNQNPNALLESLREAGGGGAGASPAGASTSTSMSTSARAGSEPSTTVARTPSVSLCYGDPPRQVPSVYSGPCVGAWHGNNGGQTAKNVFANEVRIGIEGSTNAPPSGRLPDPSTDTPATDAGTVNWQALEEYANEHFQFYGRRVVFYGVPDPSSDGAADAEANAVMADDQYHLFAQSNTIVSVCKAFAERQLTTLCSPVSHADFEAQRPYLFSSYMELDQLIGFGAEYVCKSLKDRDARYGGPDVNGKPRKYGYLGYFGGKGGIDAAQFARTIKQECGIDVEVATLSSDSDAQGAASAVTRFRADGVTSIIFLNELVNVLTAMETADSLTYTPEWVMIGEYALDVNLIGETLPAKQSAHLFGISTTEEWPQVPATTECYRAIRSVMPTLNPSSGICTVYWLRLLLLLDGIQGAGPYLTPTTFQQGLNRLGHRFGWTPWMLGGGFGPDEFSYQDDVGTVWYSRTAQDVQDGSVGAYVWTHGGRRFQLGQLPSGEDPELFAGGSSTAPSD